MSYRVMHKFWLDISKHDERDLAQKLVTLKTQRAYASTIRDALRLFLDLRQGKVDVLLKLFPWIKDAFQSTPVQPDQRLQEQIARLEALMLSQGNVPVQRAQQDGAERHSLVEVAGPSKSSSKKVAQNFVDSMKSFANGFFD